MRGIFADRIELDGLAMLQNKRSYLARSQALLNHLAGQNGVSKATTEPLVEEDESIVNRSPRTTNNNYPVKSDGPWVALIAFMLVLMVVLALSAGIWWAANRPASPETPVVQPVTPVQPVNPIVQPIQPSQGIKIKVLPPDPPLFK